MQEYPERPPETVLPPIMDNSTAEAMTQNASRPLNVRDALSYLEMVRQQFGDQPDVYNRFLEIMKDFKSHVIDTPGVIERVSNLFRSHPALIHGFNTFLPPGYSLEATNNPADPVKVIAPPNRPSYPYHPSPFAGNPLHEPVREEYAPSLPPITNITPVSQPPPAPYAPAPPRPPVVPQEQPPAPAPAPKKGPIEFNYAINYVNKIKTRYAKEPEVYRQFLEILQAYQREARPIQEVYTQVKILFRGSQDLLEEFKQFLPDNTQAPPAQQVPSKPVAKKPQRRTAPVNPPSAYSGPPPQQSLPPPKKKTRVAKPEKPGSMEELEFFEKVKRVIANKQTYNEFLKVLNLFSQELLDSKTLIERVEPFLSKSQELFDWFKRFVKYEEDSVIYNIPADRPDLDLRTCRKSGHSYRKLPKHIPRPICSGRDELCKDVLSDDWISHPVYVSETGFVAHKKTMYEEAMYKSEEERYEFDLNIEANLHVISLLEPIAKKLQQMSPEERKDFKLEPGLGGTSVAIYTTVIKKIYDNQRGLEVIEALYNNPAVAVPVVLKRLKQKDEEWKRSQREWRKVWKEIDLKNFSKSLDHQGVHFKQADRKAVNVKSLLTEIEVLHREQREKRSALANRYQFDFAFNNLAIFEDCSQLLSAYVETGPGGLSNADEDRILELLKSFVPLFFFLNEQSLPEEEGDKMEVDGQEQAPRRRTTYSFYANTALYALFRLYQMLYSRLLKMKELSEELVGDVPRSEVVNPTAVDLGLVKEAVKGFTEKDRYAELLKMLPQFLSGELDPNDFEDRVRNMYWTSGYIIFTVDRLVQAIVKQV
ncbi:SIN3-like protein B, transcription regulator [Gorgonomyces haynaldii]|nr:SIN3-like protein B, transcription regulator [Gorgonomyces haynaldii]